MSKRKYSQKEHDDVILASLVRYSEYCKKGYIVSINPGTKQCHDIGGGLFPDIVVWTPNNKNGITHIIEEVETDETVSLQKADDWEKYSNFGTTFYLVVPKRSYQKAIQIIKARGIRLTMLQYYYVSKEGEILFSTDK